MSIDLGGDPVDEVAAADRARAARQRHVDRVGRDPRLERAPPRARACALRAPPRAPTRTSLAALPTAGRSSAGERPSPRRTAVSEPFLPRTRREPRRARRDRPRASIAASASICWRLQFFDDSHARAHLSRRSPKRKGAASRPWIQCPRTGAGSRGTTSVGPHARAHSSRDPSGRVARLLTAPSRYRGIRLPY